MILFGFLQANKHKWVPLHLDDVRPDSQERPGSRNSSRCQPEANKSSHNNRRNDTRSKLHSKRRMTLKNLVLMFIILMTMYSINYLRISCRHCAPFSTKYFQSIYHENSNAVHRQIFPIMSFSVFFSPSFPGSNLRSHIAFSCLFCLVSINLEQFCFCL